MRALLPFLVACAVATPTAVEHPIPVAVSGQERIVSEDGELTLRSGQVSVQRAVLRNDDVEVVWFTNQRIDLSTTSSTIEAVGPPPPGTYTQLVLTVGAIAEDGPGVDLVVQGEDREPLQIVHPGAFSAVSFLSPELVVAEDNASELGLELVLTGLCFYVRTYSLAEDGIFDATKEGMDQGFFEGNVINAFRPVLGP